MGVKLKEKVKGSGEWWIFIDHKGKRKAREMDILKLQKLNFHPHSADIRIVNFS